VRPMRQFIVLMPLLLVAIAACAADAAQAQQPQNLLRKQASNRA